MGALIPIERKTAEKLRARFERMAEVLIFVIRLA